MASADINFALPGPYKTEIWRTLFPLPADVADKFKLPPIKSLHLKLTYPKTSSHQAFPVLVFISGFAAYDDWYYRIVDRVASWGYVVCQYEALVGLLQLPWPMNPPTDEMLVFQPLVDWLRTENANSSSKLHALLDLDSLLLGGHSRGGKVAALIYSDKVIGAGVKALYLVDPVDELEPSAAQALKDSGRPAGLTGAGHTSNFNPADVNYTTFFAGAANGSWSDVVPAAYHTDFCDTGNFLLNDAMAFLDHIPPLTNRKARRVLQEKGPQVLAGTIPDSEIKELVSYDEEAFAEVKDVQKRFRAKSSTLAADGTHTSTNGGGGANGSNGSGGSHADALSLNKARENPRQKFAELAATPMLAWFYQQLNCPTADPNHLPQPLQTFWDWVAEQQKAGNIGDFEVKGGPTPPPAQRLPGKAQPVPTEAVRGPALA